MLWHAGLVTTLPSTFWARAYWSTALLIAAWGVVALRSVWLEDVPRGRHEALRITILAAPEATPVRIPEPERLSVPEVPPRPSTPDAMDVPDMTSAPAAGSGDPNAGSAAEGLGVTGDTTPGPADSFGLVGRQPGVSDPNARATTAGVRGTGGGGGAVVDPEALHRYAIELARRLQRDQGYPLRAQRDGWQGTTLVEVHISAQARITQVTLMHSSGHGLLDEEALAKLQRLRALPDPPQAATGQAFSVLVPIEFKLR